MSEIIKGIPNLHLFLFVGGTIACVAGLLFFKFRGRVKGSNDDNFGDYDE